MPEVPTPEVPKSEGGRPRTLDEGKRREVVALISTGYGLVGAAKYVGCTVITIRREAERDAEFGQQLRDAEKEARLKPLEAIRHKAHTHWRAAAWLLEHSERKKPAKQAPPQLKQPEINGLIEAVLNKLFLELTDDPIGQTWYLSAAAKAKDKILKKAPVRTGQEDFDRMLERGMQIFADHAPKSKRAE